MAFTVKLADKIFYIEHVHPELESFCKDYLVEDCTPDFEIQLTEQDIIYEESHATEQSFSAPYLETLALLRKISAILPGYKRLLMHGASISYEGQAFLFARRRLRVIREGQPQGKEEKCPNTSKAKGEPSPEGNARTRA